MPLANASRHQDAFTLLNSLRYRLDSGRGKRANLRTILRVGNSHSTIERDQTNHIFRVSRRNNFNSPERFEDICRLSQTLCH